MMRTLLLLSLLLLASPAWAQQKALPAQIPLFPLPDVVLLPGVARPLFIFEERYRLMVDEAMAGDKVIGMILLRPGYEANYEGTPPIVEIGTAAEIVDFAEMDDGRYAIVVRGLTKFRVASEERKGSHRLARVTAIPEFPPTPEERAQLPGMRERMIAFLASPLAPLSDMPARSLSDEAFMNALVMYVAMLPPLRQDLLERSGPFERAERLLELFQMRQ